jgi:Tfp pilus assembly protein PilF
MGLKEKAAEHLRQALAVNPGDARLHENGRFLFA